MKYKTHRFTTTDLMVIIAVICILGLLIVPALSNARTRRAQKPCTNNMKQIGIAIQMYFSDGAETIFPTNTKYNYLDKNSNIAKVLDLDPQILKCPAKRKKGGNVYSIDKHIQGMDIIKWENSDSIIGYDSTKSGSVDVHSVANKANGLFGDGHVEPILENKTRAYK